MRRELAAPFAVAAAAIIGMIAGCTEITSSTTQVVAISFDTIAFPAVVAGDTLRDSLGRAAALHAIGLNSAGNVVIHAPFRYISLDTGVTIDTAGYLTAQVRSGTVRLLASVNGFQSTTRTLIIARRPDSIAVTGSLNDTVFYVLPDLATTNVSPSLALKVATYDTVGGVTGTSGWLVSYQAFFHGAPLSQKDTTIATLWDDGTAVSAVDTTDPSGNASRRLRIRPVGLPTAAESLVVVATIKYKGVQVKGSPVTWVIYTRPH